MLPALLLSFFFFEQKTAYALRISDWSSDVCSSDLAVAFAMTSASASSISDSRPWLERFIWSFGSPNLCTSGELCNWHKDFTHALTFGRGISTPDYANTSLAVLWGHNQSPEIGIAAWREKVGKTG